MIKDNPALSALFTDLYELTMAQAFDAEGLNRPAVFELFFREMPAARNYVLAAGLGDVLDYLEDWKFTPDDLSFLAQQGVFSDDFLHTLGNLRFTGDVYAVPEGTVVFQNEPLLQVVAPIIEAQIVETLVLNQIHFQSMAATKAARVVKAAGGRTVVDFGSRRAHGLDAALKVARAGYIAGVAGTSNVLAGKIYGVPTFGTMAHSYIQAHDDEAATFEAFASLYPKTTLLVDTYETLSGIRKVIGLSKKLGTDFQPAAIRLDSGDLASLAAQARRMMDEAGFGQIKIFVSGGLDEYKIDRLIKRGAPIDGFGVGTRMAVSSDVPDLDMAYKLVEYDGQPRIKLSSSKEMHPGRKQIFRKRENGRPVKDVIGRHDEQIEGEPLIQAMMKNGRRLPAGRMELTEAREHARRELDRLPEAVKSLRPSPEPYPVHFSPRLEQDLTALREDILNRQGY